VVYLVAFDKEIAAKALAKMQTDMPGEAYLDKIVQVPFELPKPDRSSIQTILFQQLQIISAETPRELFDETEWGNVYLDGLEHFIRTPRDIVRLTNTVSVTYPAVKGEVNLVDFLAIETLRVFCPYVYDIIRNNSGAFVGQTDDGGLLVYPLAPTIEGLRAFYDGWMSKVEATDKDAIIRLLKRIFPKTKFVWENTRYGSEWLSQWRKSRRVCSPDVFPVYFRLAIPSGDISNAEMEMILAVTNDSEKFGATLVDLSHQLRPDGTSKVQVALDRINDYTDVEIQPTSISPIIKALFYVGDELLVTADRSVGVLTVGNDIRISRIVYRLLRRLNESDRFELLSQSIIDGHATSTIVHEVSILGQEHGKYGGKLPSNKVETTVNQEQLRQLELKALEKIRDSAKEGALLRAPSFLGIIYRWRDWAGDAEVQKWVQAVVETRDGLVHFLEKFLVWSFSQPVSDAIGTTSYKIDGGITLFVDPPQIIDHVRSLVNDSSLSNQEKLTIQLFLSEYDKK
jgi:predicted KAP-like P-loop ATPase